MEAVLEVCCRMLVLCRLQWEGPSRALEAVSSAWLASVHTRNLANTARITEPQGCKAPTRGPDRSPIPSSAEAKGLHTVSCIGQGWVSLGSLGVLCRSAGSREGGGCPVRPTAAGPVPPFTLCILAADSAFFWSSVTSPCSEACCKC